MMDLRCNALWRFAALLSFTPLLLIGCGGSDEGGVSPPPSERAMSRVTLQVTFSEDVIEIRQVDDTVPPPQAPDATASQVTRLEIRIEATEAGFVPIVQSVPLTADDQEGVVLTIEVPQGLQRQVSISGFNADSMEIFRETTTVDLLSAVQALQLALSRILIVEATKPLDLTQRSFPFPDGQAFGVKAPVTLIVGTFDDTVAPLVLETPARRIPGTIRVGETCTLQFAPETLPPEDTHLTLEPCERDIIEGRLVVTNATAAVQSASAAPTPFAFFVLDQSQLDVLSQRIR